MMVAAGLRWLLLSLAWSLSGCQPSDELSGLLDRPREFAAPPQQRFRPHSEFTPERKTVPFDPLARRDQYIVPHHKDHVNPRVPPPMRRKNRNNTKPHEGDFTARRVLHMRVRRPDGGDHPDAHRLNLPATPCESGGTRRQGKANSTTEQRRAFDAGQQSVDKQPAIPLRVKKFGHLRTLLDDKFHQKPHPRPLSQHPRHHPPTHDLLGRIKYRFGVVGNKWAEESEEFFIDASHLLPAHPAALRYGGAVLDMDGSPNSFELFIAGFGTANMALKWDADFKRFHNFAPETLLQRRGYDSTGVTACDMDGDGDEEIYVLNTDSLDNAGIHGDHVLNRNPNNGNFTDLLTQTASVDSRVEFEPTSVACVDTHGTGRYSIATASYGTELHLFDLETAFHDQGAGRRQLRRSHTTDSAKTSGFVGIRGGRAVAPGPILADSQHMDIFLGSDSAQTSLEYNRSLGSGSNMYFLNQNGKFREVAKVLEIEDVQEDSRGVALFDADNDGTIDILVGNWNGHHRLFLQKNSGFQTKFVNAFSSHAISEPLAVRTVIVADFDNDGMEEVFFNAMEEPNRMFSKSYENNKLTWTRRNLGPATEPDGFGTGALVGDFNDDGVLELLLIHGESRWQKLTYFKVRNAGRNYLRVFPKTAAGAPARGSRVTLVAGGVTQMRIIDAGSGYLCTQEPIAHFGLGTVTTVDSVTVQFPSGHVKTIPAPEMRQTLIIQDS